MNPDEIRIRVTIDDPCAPFGALPQEVWFNVNRAEFRDSFAPLPRDRELDFAVEERRRAEVQCVARQRAADLLAQKPSSAIIEAIGKIDTINGYSPREWQQMHR